jgi:hypothetical protein
MTHQCNKVLAVIEAICREKTDRNIHPPVATDTEIFNRLNGCIPPSEIKQAINRLIQTGRLHWGKTINSNYFKPKNNCDETN